MTEAEFKNIDSLDVKESDILDTRSPNSSRDEVSSLSAGGDAAAAVVSDRDGSDLTDTEQDDLEDYAAGGDGPPVGGGSCATLPLPWGARRERHSFPASVQIDPDLRPGEFVMRTLFAEFTVQAERKIETVMMEPLERPLSKSLQRGEDAQFDQMLSTFGSAAEHCLPSLLRTLFAWYDRQGVDVAAELRLTRTDAKGKVEPTTDRQEREHREDRRDLAVEFIFCLVLIEVLRQFYLHPGHEDLVRHLENLAFRHFKYRESTAAGPNSSNVNIIADLYAEVIGVLAQSRIHSVRARFMHELRELHAKESSQQTTQGIIALLMGMKFFRVKMVPIEEFEISFQFMQELSQYFLEVKDKDIKHALAGLFVEILVPVAACVKNEVNVPCLKTFVEMLYTHTLDMCTKGKHRLAIFPLVTCLLCVSQKQFFLSNWHYFLAMCLSNLKNKDPKMSRVALESLYRLLWVYMIRIKCESNSATQSRLQSIVNSLFPKGSKNVVPRDTPLNIFVKIIQFIAQERLDFAMREIVFDLLSVGRAVKIVTTPERMSIGLRAFLVVADSLQQKEGEPPMPRTVGVLPSGNTLRVKKTFLSKMLTDDAARSIGVAAYYPYVRKVFSDILRALDSQFGRPLMMTNTQNVNKEPDERITGERKPKIDLFRTCVAAIPRLVPDGMTRIDLIEMLARLTVHMDEELRALSFQSLTNLAVDFPDWREEVVLGMIWFMNREVADTSPTLLDNGLRMVLQLLTSWRNAIAAPTNGSTIKRRELNAVAPSPSQRTDQPGVLHMVEGFALVMLCHCRLAVRRLAVHILKEVKLLFRALDCLRAGESPAVDAMDAACPVMVERCLPLLPPAEKAAALSTSNIDLQWIAERNSAVWTAGLHDDGAQSGSVPHLAGGDAWAVCLQGFLEHGRLAAAAPAAVAHAWPMVHYRIQALFSVIDPTPVSDNRASLLRGTTTVKKPPDQRDIYMGLWRNYALFACRVVPAVSTPGPTIRCVSPELSVSASPESAGGDRPDPASLHRLLVPLLRCEAQHVRDSVTDALGHINHLALKDLMLELAPYIREAVDRKQENMRRRRRRDTLRQQLVKVFEMIADQGTFGLSPSIIDTDSQTLYPTFVEYIDGARLYLEAESDKTSDTTVQQIKLFFCNFIRKLITSFPLDLRVTLLKRDLRRNLVNLFAPWSGAFGRPFLSRSGDAREQSSEPAETVSELELAALTAMWTVVCCGQLFDPAVAADDGDIYRGLDILLACADDKVQQLARETLVLLLEFNPDISALLDWSVDRCYTGSSQVSDCCFLAIATVFSAKEYPCDHYTAVINVTLLNTGCPRTDIHQTALQLLQLLDKRFFGRDGRHLATENETDAEKERREQGTLDAQLAATYCRSQMFLSRQLAQLHPHLTMPMFSEVTYRLQTARPMIRQRLLQYLLPWLYNMELVDPNIQPMSPLAKFQYFSQNETASSSQQRREGWGSAEATEMVINNLFYITAKIGDDHPKELEDLWAALCSCWPNNLKIILRSLFILCGMAPSELLPYGRRVAVYMARARPDQLVEEMMTELQTVESMNCTIERTETPPFFRITSLRKTSNHSVTECGGSSQLETAPPPAAEKGTLHTKRHSGEEILRDSVVGPARAVSHSLASSVRSSSTVSSSRSQDRSRLIQEEMGLSRQQVPEDNFTLLRAQTEDHQQQQQQMQMQQDNTPQPHPLPMPEYGGYFAPLSSYLPNCSQPIASFHRCNLALMLIQDVVVDGLESPSLVWPLHVPFMLHIIFLGLDNARLLVHENCKQLLLNMLVVLSKHGDHLSVAAVLLSCRAELLDYGLTLPPPPVTRQNLTEKEEQPRKEWEEAASCASSTSTADTVLQFLPSAPAAYGTDSGPSSSLVTVPTIVAGDESEPASLVSVCAAEPAPLRLPQLCLALVDFLASRRCQPMWGHEDISAKVWHIHSAEQLSCLLGHVVRIFGESLPSARVQERWAQVALHVALSCSSRHYASRSLQVFRALRMPITGRMLSDILSRLVETVAEQGEDMQGYVTEMMLTLESAVDCIDSDFRPIDFVKDLFKSTPNLINKEPRRPHVTGSVGPACGTQLAGHLRSTSFSTGQPASTARKQPTSPTNDREGRPGRAADGSSGRSPSGGQGTALSRSRSASSLKQMSSDPDTEENKLTVLSQLFWLSVCLLESDFEYEYLLAMRLLEKVLCKLSLDRPDCRDRVERLQLQLRWPTFPGVHALLLKGCTNPATYEPALTLLTRFSRLLDVSVVDPSLSTAFPLNVIALLPYMVYHYEDANPLCIQAAENIAQVCMEKSKKLDNLATVMTLYSRRTFSKESFQWTKCVVKYLMDTYTHLSIPVITFLVEVLEKGPPFVQQPILNVLHCLLHYMDLGQAASHPINADLLRAVARYAQQQGQHWREALRILKLAVTQSSSLAAAPSSGSTQQADASGIHVSFVEAEVVAKKELPGRTMEFTFDVSQTPIIGRRVTKPVSEALLKEEGGEGASPRRSVSTSLVDVASGGWKRPWLSQSRTRDRLLNLLISCGTRVGLPKSPSVIFSQTSDMLERQSSMASSTEEVSGVPHESAESLDEHEAQQFGVIREFDFLEYELESQEGESLDNFNWGVRRRSLSNLDPEESAAPPADSSLLSPTHHSADKTTLHDESSDDDGGSVSPLDDGASFESTSSAAGATIFAPDSLLSRERHTSESSESSGSRSNGSHDNTADLTPCNASPSLGHLMEDFAEAAAAAAHTDAEEQWQQQVAALMAEGAPPAAASGAVLQLCKLLADMRRSLAAALEESRHQLAAVEVARPLCDVLQVVVSTLQSLELPHVYASGELLSTLGVLPRLRFTFLELQEHLEGYQQRREHLLRCLDVVRSTVPLRGSGDSSGPLDETYIDLCRTVYKLHFQLLLLMEGFAKTLSLISVDAQGVVDLTSEVTQLRYALGRVQLGPDSESDSESDSVRVSTRREAEALLMELLNGEQLEAAVRFYRRHRSLFPAELTHEGDDVSTVIDLFCHMRAESQPVVSLSPTTALCTACATLQEASMQLLSAVRQLEAWQRQQRRRADSALRKTEC